MNTVLETLKPVSDFFTIKKKNLAKTKQLLLSILTAFLLKGRFGRNLVFGFLERNIERMMKATNDSGITYVRKTKAKYIISLIKQASKNIDTGIFSKQYAEKAISNMYEGLFYNNESSLNFKKVHGTLPPAFCTISPTHRCNLNCEGCYAASTSSTTSSLSYPVVDRLVNEMHDLFGARFIVFSGGEPFMWNDGGKGIIDIAEAHRDMFFMVYTNGLLIDEDKLKRLMDTANLNPAISVEGFEDLTDKRRGKGAYKKIMSRFEMMRKYGFPFGLSVTTTKNNIDLLMNDPFYEYWFDTVGIMYMWMFQYMPIGRAKDVTELMLSPAERVSLLKEWEHLLFDKSYFVADFWNSGSASDGCVAYGRRGGYFHVNWKGNISPCVFVPYWKDNINELYSSGKTIMDAIFSDYFKRGREWQKGQGCFTPGARNHFAPCSMRDNYHDFRTKILTDDVHPDDKNAEEALLDPAYYQRLNEFDKELWKLTYPMWQERAKVKD